MHIMSGLPTQHVCSFEGLLLLTCFGLSGLHFIEKLSLKKLIVVPRIGSLHEGYALSFILVTKGVLSSESILLVNLTISKTCPNPPGNCGYISLQLLDTSWLLSFAYMLVNICSLHFS